jgi:hypothetical protein
VATSDLHRQLARGDRDLSRHAVGAPSDVRARLPSDLLGLTTAEYDAGRIRGGEARAAVETTIGRAKVRIELERIEDYATDGPRSVIPASCRRSASRAPSAGSTTATASGRRSRSRSWASHG